mmetsp:Transcript_5360/g.13409  ORF Transcript_5360/g.13409 Transcript_5360/m.13409 type:complete len:207 (+) Transcript_5360:498-1118(+)
MGSYQVSFTCVRDARAQRTKHVALSRYVAQTAAPKRLASISALPSPTPSNSCSVPSRAPPVTVPLQDAVAASAAQQNSTPIPLGARFATAPVSAKSPCAVPPSRGGTVFCSTATAGPNQHSATRYFTASHAIASLNVFAFSTMNQTGAARTDPRIGTASCPAQSSHPPSLPHRLRGTSTPATSDAAPPTMPEVTPHTPTMIALTTA